MSMFSPTKSESFHSLSPAGYLQPAQQRVMDLFTSTSVVMTRKEITAALGDMELSSVCGRVRALLDAKRLAPRGERIDPKTRKPQELVGLPVPMLAQQELFQ